MINLNNISDEELFSHGTCGLMEVLLKRASKANFLAWLRASGSLLRRHIAVVYVEEAIIYCLEVANVNADALIEAFASIDPTLNEPLMNAARQIEERGEARGRQEGMQTRSLEIARNMFQAGEPIERVARWTGLSEASIRSL